MTRAEVATLSRHSGAPSRVYFSNFPQRRGGGPRRFTLGAGGFFGGSADPSSRAIASSAGALLFRPSGLRMRALAIRRAYRAKVRGTLRTYRRLVPHDFLAGCRAGRLFNETGNRICCACSVSDVTFSI
jgi:hypothetical protein